MVAKNLIKLQQVEIANSKIIYHYQVIGKIREAFNQAESFTIDYFENIANTPLSIAVIPFLANVLPMAWVYDAEIEVAELDRDFWEKLDQVKTGFVKMYPKIKFGGQLRVAQLISSQLKLNNDATGLLFSGGVDATSSLIAMLKAGYRPRLITLWGADVALNDQAGWQEKSQHTEFVAQLFQLPASFVKSEFRTFLSEGVLDKKVEARAGDMWWHGFQHGLGILGHAAPLIYKYQLQQLHIAATFVEGNTVPCASDPSIDEHFCVAGHQTIHNGYDLNRQKKVANICEFVQQQSDLERLPIKVCWKSEGAKNCGVCEKCMRTAGDFLAEGGDLAMFALEKFDGNYAQHFVKKQFWLTENLRADWEGAQQRLIANNPTYCHDNHNIDWLKKYNFNKINRQPGKIVKRISFVANKKLRRAIPQSFKRVLKRGQK